MNALRVYVGNLEWETEVVAVTFTKTHQFHKKESFVERVSSVIILRVF